MTGLPRIAPLSHAVALTGVLWAIAASADPARISGAPVVYVRSGPGPEHRPVSVLSEGDEVETLGETGPWMKIRTQSGEEGFVFGTFVAQADDPTPDPLEAAVSPPSEVPNLEDAAPPPAAPPTPPGLVQEVAELRAEIEALKARMSKEIVRQRAEDTPAVREINPAPERPRPGALDPNLRTAAVGIVALSLGWVLGTMFTRWRLRGQRNRLRF